MDLGLFTEYPGPTAASQSKRRTNPRSSDVSPEAEPERGQLLLSAGRAQASRTSFQKLSQGSSTVSLRLAARFPNFKQCRTGSHYLGSSSGNHRCDGLGGHSNVCDLGFKNGGRRGCSTVLPQTTNRKSNQATSLRRPRSWPIKICKASCQTRHTLSTIAPEFERTIFSV
jgi:hypothetical protein